MDEMAKVLEKYLARLEEEGQKLPGIGRTGNPHFGAISVTSGVDYKFLTTEPAGRLISVAAEALGVECLPRLRGKKLFEQNSSFIANYLKHLGGRGLTLPENPIRRGEIFYRQVELEAGLDSNTLVLIDPKADEYSGARLREMLHASLPRLGIAVRILSQSPQDGIAPITYERLLERGTEERRRELRGRSNADPQLYNTRSALRSFCKAIGLSVTASVGREFVADFKKSIEVVMSQRRNVGSRRKFQTEIRWWFNFYQRLIKEQSLPDDFHKTLVQLVDRSGLPLRVFAKLIEVPPSTLMVWYKGESRPTARSLTAVSRLESLSYLPAGTLINKLRHSHLGWRIKASQLPDFLRENKRLAYRVCPHLPGDFCELPEERQQEVFDDVRAWLSGIDYPHTRMLTELQKLPYGLTHWPPPLEEEFGRLVFFKTADRPPIGMKRNGRWRLPTKDKAHSDFARFFGALSLPKDAADARVRGLGVPAPDLTMALLACPLVVDWFIRFRCEIRSNYTVWSIGFLQNLRCMLAAGTGWLRQQPQLASRLRPVSYDQAESLSCGQTELVSPELITRARADWDGVCDTATAFYKHLMSELGFLIAPGRDPFHRIEGIVEMDDPMKVFPILLRSMRREMPSRDTRPTQYHVAIRNCVLVMLAALTGLRRNTICQLNYTGDAAGHLTLQNGRYVLRVPPALFKNENSSFFGPKNAKKDYLRRLPNVLGVTVMLSEYLNVSRPFLLSKYHPDCKEQPFLINAGRKNARVQPEQVSAIYAEATRRHLADNKWRRTGLYGVGPHSIHSVRHIRGTAAVKKTGSFQIAGDANQQTEWMAHAHYAQYTPEDRTRHANSFLFPEEEQSEDPDDPEPTE